MQSCKHSPKPKFIVAETVKTVVFEALNLLLLISRKILILVKLPNFHTMQMILGLEFSIELTFSCFLLYMFETVEPSCLCLVEVSMSVSRDF